MTKDGKYYFKRCKRVIAQLCEKCPHRKDHHQMNCIECCPVRRAFDEWQHPTKATAKVKVHRSIKTEGEIPNCPACGKPCDQTPGKIYCVSQHGRCSICGNWRSICKCMMASVSSGVTAKANGIGKVR
jgi:hypothetical protein